MKEIFLSPSDNLQYILCGLTEPTTIYLSAGVYNCKVKITCPNVRVVGASRETTVIVYDDYARKIHADGREYNTFRTYTLMVAASGVTLENLTVKNSNVNPREVGQCVALSVNATDFKAVNCDFVSTQDTVFLSPFPDDLVVRYRGFIPQDELYSEGSFVQLFSNCRIYGTVDFIFGCGEAYFKDCELISAHDERGKGYVAAPAHSLAQKTGFVFWRCSFKDGGAGENSVYLARPWRDFGKCEFLDCTLENHIKPELYDKWNDTERDKTARFGHFNLAGNIAPVTWSRELSAAEAKKIIARFANLTEK